MSHLSFEKCQNYFRLEETSWSSQSQRFPWFICFDDYFVIYLLEIWTQTLARCRGMVIGNFCSSAFFGIQQLFVFWMNRDFAICWLTWLDARLLNCSVIWWIVFSMKYLWAELLFQWKCGDLKISCSKWDNIYQIRQYLVVLLKSCCFRVVIWIFCCLKSKSKITTVDKFHANDKSMGFVWQFASRSMPNWLNCERRSRVIEITLDINLFISNKFVLTKKPTRTTSPR